MKGLMVVLGIAAVVAVAQADSLDCRLVGSCDTPGSAYGVAVLDTFAYVADWNQGLRIINIEDPQSPYEVGHFDTPNLTEGVAMVDSFAYLADGAVGGLCIVNVTDPQEVDPELVAWIKSAYEGAG